MKRLIIAALAALMLSGCGLAGGYLAKNPPSAKFADSLGIEATTPEERQLRMCLVGAYAAEVGADRVLRFDIDDAFEVSGVIAKLEAKIEDIRTDETKALWVNTELFEVKRVIVIAAGERVKDRVISMLTAGGVFSFEDARRAFDFIGKSEAMIRDVATTFEALHAGTITLDEAWKACENRLAYNRDRVEALTR